MSQSVNNGNASIGNVLVGRKPFNELAALVRERNGCLTNLLLELRNLLRRRLMRPPIIWRSQCLMDFLDLNPGFGWVTWKSLAGVLLREQLRVNNENSDE